MIKWGHYEETLEGLINKDEIDSQVTVRRGNNQMGKKKDKANIAKETDKVKEAKEENKVRVYSSIGDRAI